MRKYSDKKKKKELVDAQALFRGVLGRLGYRPERYAVFDIWDRLLGAQASKAKAVGLKGRRLYVEVDSSARMHDITLRKRNLIQKLNQHFGTERVIFDIIVQLSSSTEEKYKRF